MRILILKKMTSQNLAEIVIFLTLKRPKDSEGCVFKEIIYGKVNFVTFKRKKCPNV